MTGKIGMWKRIWCAFLTISLQLSISTCTSELSTAESSITTSRMRKSSAVISSDHHSWRPSHTSDETLMPDVDNQQRTTLIPVDKRLSLSSSGSEQTSIHGFNSPDFSPPSTTSQQPLSSVSNDQQPLLPYQQPIPADQPLSLGSSGSEQSSNRPNALQSPLPSPSSQQSSTSVPNDGQQTKPLQDDPQLSVPTSNFQEPSFPSSSRSPLSLSTDDQQLSLPSSSVQEPSLSFPASQPPVVRDDREAFTSRPCPDFQPPLQASSDPQQTSLPPPDDQQQPRSNCDSHSETTIIDLFSPKLYAWNASTTNVEEYLTDFGNRACDDHAFLNSPICRNMETFPCDCSEDCKLYGFCCYDRAPGGLTQAGPETTGCLENWTYAMVRCPQSWGEGGIREACETGQGRYTVDEPVSDLSTGITYRNAFCAKCHNVTVYTPWQLQVYCEHFQNVYMARSEEEFLDLVKDDLDHCYMDRVPPSNISTSACPEHFWFSAVDTCNVTGGWATEDYNADVEQNCLLYQGLALRVRHVGVTYQNLFCAVCNGAQPVTFMCSPKVGFPYMPADGSEPLSLLLGLRDRDTDSDDRHRLVTCSDGQWADLTVSMSSR
ncbi:hypothetical protein BaRGS_00015394 [Batillaria attramentaria]|uniref:SMB domain-containing protein n=1 Tax=Batillaria attramentaria TaxID=370345 RepID=A0ABD0L170_9CAEN